VRIVCRREARAHMRRAPGVRTFVVASATYATQRRSGERQHGGGSG
jgi:hypothetical protein